jgi:hypothetical protein
MKPQADKFLERYLSGVLPEMPTPDDARRALLSRGANVVLGVDNMVATFKDGVEVICAFPAGREPYASVATETSAYLCGTLVEAMRYVDQRKSECKQTHIRL